MASQELLDILNECRPPLFGSDIIALRVPKLEQVCKGHRYCRFALTEVEINQCREVEGLCDVPTPGTATGIIMVLPNFLPGG